MAGRSREFGAGAVVAPDVPPVFSHRLVAGGRADRRPHQIRERFARLAVPRAQYRPRPDILTCAVGSHVHGAVVRRRDEHRIAVEPGVGHGVHDQLRLPRTGRPGHDGQRVAPEPVEG